VPPITATVRGIGRVPDDCVEGYDAIHYVLYVKDAKGTVRAGLLGAATIPHDKDVLDTIEVQPSGFELYFIEGECADRVDTYDVTQAGDQVIAKHFPASDQTAVNETVLTVDLPPGATVTAP